MNDTLSNSIVELKEDVSNLDYPPVFPLDIYDSLPELLKKVTKAGQHDQEKDLLLLGSIIAVSACLPKTYGIYSGQRIYPNLYLFVSAMASAGKGILNHCKGLIRRIHDDLVTESENLMAEYEMELSQYFVDKKKSPDILKPTSPKMKMLFIPANNSATGTFQLLNDNESSLMFETEGDTLALTFKSDYGNYSDGFRKAFHHETISYYRRTDREYVEINEPKLSVLLSGTPQQILSLIPDAENGLFSRFLFYTLPLILEWKDVFANPVGKSLDEYFQLLGDEFYDLYKSSSFSQPTEFKFSEKQQELFNTQFSQWQDQYSTLIGLDYIATVRRLGVVAFRIAMILSKLRVIENQNQCETLNCSDIDFDIAMKMVDVLILHAKKVFNQVPGAPRTIKRTNLKEKFLGMLPKEFNRSQYLKTAKELKIPIKTAEGYITKFISSNLLHKPMHNTYEKVNWN